MNDRLTRWFPLLLLAILAALTFWLDRAVQPPAGKRDGSTRHDPDYIVEKLSALRMAPDGGIKHTLFAEKMIHYPDDDSTYLQSPKFVSYASGKTPMTITAREALVSKNGENVYFQNDVRVTRAPYDDKSELVMQTSYLHVIPDDNIAKTDRPVTITDANTVVNAIGLELNGETRILKLKSRVRGIYDQNKK
ncbi:MAG: LPS export ABC transporter periplasmic protein LptC [Burkholderiales bacterium]|nr:LPS export ABC transporter periplasmic protein LptC [Burkholderiales bacterium]